MQNTLRGRSLLGISDLSREDIESILALAQKQKKKGVKPFLKGETLALVFEKPSLRTKVSFDVAMHQLGGNVIYLAQQEVGLGVREPISDVSKVLGRYVSVIAARTFEHSSVVQLREHAGIPVINALSDQEHPCQALADLLTIREHKGKIEGLRVAFVGDGNNVAISLAQAVTICGGHFVIAAPSGYRLPKHIQDRAKGYAEISGGSFAMTDKVNVAVKDADVVYTDVWTSMGQEEEQKERLKAFNSYQVTQKVMEIAAPDAIFMHDLPAHRGEEVAEDVIDGPQSVVFDQAENRLHAQRALLSLILAPRD